MKDCIDTQNDNIRAKVFENKIILNRLFEIGSFRAGDPDEERGRFFFGEDQNEELEMIGNSLLRLVLENFVFWPIMFPNSSE